MKTKIQLQIVTWSLICLLIGFIILNTIIFLLNISNILNSNINIFDVWVQNLFWTVPISLILGFFGGFFNYIFNKKNIFKKNNQSNINNLFLVDQRNKTSKIKNFEKIISKNLSSSGVVVYWTKNKKQFNWYVLPEVHVRVLGTTGSYKTWFFILGNIYRNLNDLSIEERPNMVIIDPKGELYENSIKFNKKNFYNLIQLDFTNPDESIGWNPLSKIWHLYHTNEIKLQNLAISKIQEFLKSIPALDETNANSPNWPIGATAYLNAILLFMLEYSYIDKKMNEQHFNLINLHKLAANIEKFKEIIDFWSDQRDKNYLPIYPKINQIRNDISFILDADEGPKTSYQSFATAAISQFVTNKDLWPILCNNEINFNTMFEKTNKKPFAFFITYADDQPSTHPLVSIIVSQAYQAAIDIARLNKQKGKGEKLDRKLQFFIDEFGVLPKIHQFENWVNIARSRNIQIVIAYQSEDQLNISYNKNRKVIEDGFTASLLLSTANWETAEKFSKMIGITSKMQESKSYSKKSSKEFSRNVSYQKERLISPEEIMQLSRMQYLLILNNQKPSILNKSLVFVEMADELNENNKILNQKEGNKFNESEIIFDFTNLMFDNEEIE